MNALGALALFAQRVWKALSGRARGGYYRLVLARVGRGCRFNRGLLIFGPENIFLGDAVTLNEGVLLQSSEGARITIGNHVHIAYGATVLTGNLDFSTGRVGEAHVGVPVVIEDRAVIGAKSVLFPGVVIGEGSVVSAGSVVTGRVPPHTVVFGNPARPLRKLESE